MDHQAKKESATNVVQSRRWPVLHGVSILTHVLFPHSPLQIGHQISQPRGFVINNHLQVAGL